jgi:hypothetical protein
MSYRVAPNMSMRLSGLGCCAARKQGAYRYAITPVRHGAKIKPFVASALARRLPGHDLRESGEMSQRTVQLVIGRLVTDEDLRACFVERPRETLLDLRDRGFELTDDEIDALARSDSKMWPAMAKRIHPRLQRCSLRST